MLYRRGKVYWYKFRFAGRLFQESTHTTSKTLAVVAERQRRRELEEGLVGLRRRKSPQVLSVVASDWLDLKKPTLAPRSHLIERTNLGHLLPWLGNLLVTDIGADDIARYQQHRLRAGAAPKTINLEIGTLRAILRRQRLWANIQPDVRFLPVRDTVGRSLTPDEEKRLLTACSESRSRSLLPAVTLALQTALRYSELRLLRWRQVDLARRYLTVGESKTDTGRGRVIPLNDRATTTLSFWADQFPDRQPDHCVFPTERYGAGGDRFLPRIYSTDPARPINSWKQAWETAKKRAGVTCRFHDLRHCCVTRMLEGGAPLAVVASILGWSSATTVRMAKRYGHIGHVAQRQAVDILENARNDAGQHSFDEPRANAPQRPN